MAPDYPISRRRVVKGMIAGGTAGLAGCSDNGGDGGNDGGGGDGGDGGNDGGGGNGGDGGTEGFEFTAWSWGANMVPLEEGAEYWNERNPHTVVPEEIDNEPGTWTSALQVQEGLPGIGLLLPEVYRSAARNGGLENINDIVKPNLDKLIDSAISAYHVDGDFYGFPHSVNPVNLIYNKNLFEDAGLPGHPEDVFDEIQTYEDLINAGEQMQEEIGVDLLVHGSETVNVQTSDGIMTEYGGGFYNPDGEFEFDQQANIEAFRMMKELQPYGANLAFFGSVIWEEIRNENVAAFLVPGWYIGFIRDNLEGMSGDWRVVQPPAPESGGPRGATAGGAPEAIPVAKDSDIKEAAKDFGEFRNLGEVSYNQKLSNWIFPANIVDDSEIYEEEVEYFGGQPVFRQIGPTLEESPPQDTPPSAEVYQMYQEAFRLVMDEDEDIEETLTSTHEDMMSVIDEEELTRMTVEEVRNSS